MGLPESQETIQVVDERIHEETGIFYYHTKVETVTIMKKEVNYLGEEKFTQKFTQLQNKRTTFAGIVTPYPTSHQQLPREEGKVQISIGAARPNSEYKETFVKKIGRRIAKGRALSNPMLLLTCNKEEAQERFLDACKKFNPYVAEFYISKQKEADHIEGYFKGDKKCRSKEEIAFELKQLI